MTKGTLTRLARHLAGIGAAALLATGVLAGTAHAATDTPPRGHFTATADNQGTVTLSGWAFDPDDVNAKLNVSFSVDGKWLLATKADQFSAELAPYGLFYSGFKTAPRIADGTHSVCMFVQNVGPVPNTGELLQCETVTVSSQSPRGVMERAGNGVGGFRGWVIDESNLNQSLDIFLVYEGSVIGVQRANQPSPQLYPYGIPGNHGYYFNAPADPHEPGLALPGQYCVFAVNIGKGYNTTIGCVEVA